jgi:DNA-directed RNA polymerase alpha subunit
VDIIKTKAEELLKLPGFGEKKVKQIKQAAEDFLKKQASEPDTEKASPQTEDEE